MSKNVSMEIEIKEDGSTDASLHGVGDTKFTDDDLKSIGSALMRMAATILRDVREGDR